MYTTDKKAIASDQMFVDFITSTYDALVVEDTDHLLRARTSGNEDMHRFLAIADGIARAQSRKIIFTTNLPNVTDIDPALTRPGRCHAVVNLRSLTQPEAWRLAARICGEDVERMNAAAACLSAEATKAYSVAQVYRACAAAAVGA
jgi:ATP-dependent 26S proteasome regulatory subunit